MAKNRKASIDFGEIQYEKSLINILIRVQFEEDSSKFTKIRVTTEIFQKTENPIKYEIGDQFSWKSSRLKGRDCFTGVR